MLICLDIIINITNYISDPKDTIKISCLNKYVYQNRKYLQLNNVGQYDTMENYNIHRIFNIRYLNIHEYMKIFRYLINLSKEHEQLINTVENKYPKFKIYVLNKQNMNMQIPKNTTHLYICDNYNTIGTINLPNNLLYLHAENISFYQLPKSLIHISTNICDPRIFQQLPNLCYIDFFNKDNIISYDYKKLPANLLSLKIHDVICGNNLCFPKNIKILNINCKTYIYYNVFLPDTIEILYCNSLILKRICNVPNNLKKIIVEYIDKYSFKNILPILIDSQIETFGFPKVKLNHNIIIQITGKYNCNYKIYNQDEKYFLYKITK